MWWFSSPPGLGHDVLHPRLQVQHFGVAKIPRHVGYNLDVTQPLPYPLRVWCWHQGIKAQRIHRWRPCRNVLAPD